MIRVALPITGVKHRLPFYLAMEEWVARRMPKGEYFFTWSVDPTVIYGRNQDVAAEVDLSYCQAHGIEVYRRKSGGGCVYADADNLMVSYITPDTCVATAFGRYTAMLAQALQALGVDAQPTGRNDVVIDGRKVSGNAFYRLPMASIMHGTMLVSTQMEHMLRAITPSRSKLESKQVQSVASRITTLREHLPSLTVQQLAHHLHTHLATSEVTLSDAALSEIAEIERGYYDERWLRGRNGATSAHPYTAIVPGVGTLQIGVDIADGRIADIDLVGDFFMTGDLDSMIVAPLRGVQCTPHAISQALHRTDAADAINGLDTDTLARLIVEAIDTKNLKNKPIKT